MSEHCEENRLSVEEHCGPARGSQTSPHIGREIPIAEENGQHDDNESFGPRTGKRDMLGTCEGKEQEAGNKKPQGRRAQRRHIQQPNLDGNKCPSPDCTDQNHQKSREKVKRSVRRAIHEATLFPSYLILLTALVMPSPGIEPRPQVPETCMISISPRGHEKRSIHITSTECEQRADNTVRIRTSPRS